MNWEPKVPLQTGSILIKVGDIVTAKCVGIDDKGKVKMSRKAAMKEKDDAAKAEAGGAVDAPAA